MARNVERCTDCGPRGRCRRHQACLDHRDAWLAAELGCAWADRVWRQVDLRRPWPTFDGPCAAIATRLVAWLTKDVALARRRELAEICSWRAGIRWEALQAGSRDRPYRTPSARTHDHALPGHAHVVLRAAVSPLEAAPGAWAERCADCTPEALCPRHAECDERWDARLAADVGIGWACYAWAASDHRGPWPAFAERCAATARHLVAWLALPRDERRCDELAAICAWRAALRWDALRATDHARPRGPSHITYALPGTPLAIRLGTPRTARVVALATEALAQTRRRAARFREAQGLRAPAAHDPRPAGPSKVAKRGGRNGVCDA
jgi:hypothetical protein